MSPDPWPSDRIVLLGALGATAGALHPDGRGLVPGVALAALCALGRRAILLPVALALVVSGLAQRSLDGLDGVEPSVMAGEVTLLTDPTPSFGGLRVDVRAEGRRLEARAEGPAAAAMADLLAGERVRLRGEVAPADPNDGWLQARHVAGRLRVLAVVGLRPGHPVTQVANGLRRTLVAGTASLDDRERSLFTGLVLGDDRRQPVELADAFKGAGLTHLLAVSGQNVAFALALAGPVLRRLRLWPRLGVTLAVIGLFGVMTRFEPSVLRASAMAALAATLALPGRPVSRLRIVALAVAGLLVVDPLLIRSVGFQLSVGAAASIVVLAPSVAAVLPGPASIRDAVGVTVAAQLGVAPVLLATFGPLPVAALPANLLAVPVAGAVMVWGLTGGLVGGVVGEPVAALLHGPTRLALGWLDLVATRSSRARLGTLGPGPIGLLALSVGLAVASPARPALRRAVGSVAVGVVLTATVAAHAPPALRTAPAAGVVRWHAGATDVVVLGGAGGGRSPGDADVLAALRQAGIDAIDLLVVADAGVATTTVEAVLGSRPTAAVLVHPDAGLPSRPVPARPAAPGSEEVRVGRLDVRVVRVADRLVVEASDVAAEPGR